MNKKGFLLIDSLISIFILISICMLVINVYKIIDNDINIYDSYNQRINERLESIFNNLEICEVCLID